MFFVAGMPERIFEQRFRFALQLGLRKALKLVRLKRQVSETDEEMMAATIADHLRLAHYRIEEGPEAEGHSSLMRGPSDG
jgi:hypothetical protein